MKVYLNSITGVDDAIVSMFMSKRTWTREKEREIRELCMFAESPFAEGLPIRETCMEKYNSLIDTLVKWGWKHTTLLRFIDFSITVEGLHRAGQDDWDSHAKRFNNRIIRSSTRLSSFEYEMSDYYKDKILPTDLALSELGLEVPDKITHNGVVYVKTINGYVREGFENCQDVKRGLYMLSIPSNFIFKIDLTEWAHVYKERNVDSSANTEVKELCETIATLIEEAVPQFNRELFMKIQN